MLDPSASRRRRVAVIGGGLAGLAAAFRLQEAGVDPVIFERGEAAGGRTRTVRTGGFAIDVGAGVLPSTYVDVAKLIADAGLETITEPVDGFVGTLRDGRMHLIDMRRPKASLMASALLGWRSKLRLVRLIPALRRARGTLGFDTTSGAARFDTESIADFAKRKLDPDLLDHFIEPLIRTLYLHNADQGSIVALLWCLKNLASNSSFAIKGGMDTLARALAGRFEVRYGVDVDQVRRSGDGCVVTFATAGKNTEERFDGCVCAVDARDVQRLVGEELSQQQQAFLANLRYSVSINLHFSLSSRPDCPAVIIQVPRAADPDLAVLVQDHLKGSGRAPDGRGLISAFFLTDWGERMWSRTDADIVADALPRIEAILPGFAALVEDVHVERWRRAATICPPGHFAELAGFEAALDPGGPIQLASDLFALSSVNVAVAQGNRAARRLLLRFAVASSRATP